MAETLHSDSPSRNPQYPQGAELDFEGAEIPAPEHRLPPGVINANARVDRSARAIGYRVGAAVYGVQQLSRQVETAGSRLREAGDRARANTSVVMLQLADAAAQRAERLRHAAQSTVSEWANTAGSAASNVGALAAETWSDLRRYASERMDVARRRTAVQWNDVQRRVQQLQRDDPAKFLTLVAGTAFVIGAGLRIWRSSHE